MGCQAATDDHKLLCMHFFYELPWWSSKADIIFCISIAVTLYANSA